MSLYRFFYRNHSRNVYRMQMESVGVLEFPNAKQSSQSLHWNSKQTKISPTYFWETKFPHIFWGSTMKICPNKHFVVHKFIVFNLNTIDTSRRERKRQSLHWWRRQFNDVKTGISKWITIAYAYPHTHSFMCVWFVVRRGAYRRAYAAHSGLTLGTVYFANEDRSL